MNILKDSIQIRQRFHDFQRFTKRDEDISLNAFLAKEIEEWEELSNDTQEKIVTAYRCIIGISSTELPINKQHES